MVHPGSNAFSYIRSLFLILVFGTVLFSSVSLAQEKHPLVGTWPALRDVRTHLARQATPCPVRAGPSPSADSALNNNQRGTWWAKAGS
jgi:hypothetical protein